MAGKHTDTEWEALHPCEPSDRDWVHIREVGEGVIVATVQFTDDARLIAAAPDLLEALEYAVRQVPELATVPGIAAAIARATQPLPPPNEESK